MFISNEDPAVFITDIHIEARWDGDNVSTNRIEDTYLNWNKYFLQIQGLISFFPHLNTDGERVIKLHLGAFLKHSDRTISVGKLKSQFRKYNFRWGYVANETFRGDCAVIDPQSDFYSPFANSQHLNYDFNPRRYVPESPYNHPKAKFFRRKAITFPISCFETEEWNTIRIWWTPTNSDYADYLESVSALEIRFRLPDKITFTTPLTSTESAVFRIPFLYRIKTNYDNEISLYPIGQEELNFDSNLKDSYANSYPLESLWTFDSRPFFIKKNDLYEIFLFLPFPYFQNDFNLFTKWNRLQFNRTTTTIDYNFAEDLVVSGRTKFNRYETGYFIFMPSDNWYTYREGAPALLLKQKLSYYQHFFNVGTEWNEGLQQLDTVPEERTVFVGSWSLPFQKSTLKTLIQARSIWDYEILLVQSTILENHFFNEKLEWIAEFSTENPFLSEQPNEKATELELPTPHFEEIWLVPFRVLHEIFFELESNILENEEWKREIKVLYK